GLVKVVPEPMLVDRDEAEAARRKRIAEHRVDAGRNARRPARHLAQHEVAHIGVLQIYDRKLAALALVDRRQPEAGPLALDDAQHKLGRALELLHGVRDQALSALFGPRQHAVADAERTPASALYQP